MPSLLRSPKRDPELRGKALVAITLDLEMSRNFPTWETTHWDYEKGNLNEESKQYTVEAARRIKSAGGVLHTFVVGQVFEQENVEWLKGLLAQGHLVGNHTYDHVNVTAKQPEDIQHRFRRAPWLIAGKPVEQILRDNIAMNALAIRTRLGVEPAGFRTPGGFRDGLASVPHIQSMLLDLGYTWVSSKYPGHAMSDPGETPSDAIYDDIVCAQADGQPFTYPSGLIEIPMSPPSDINAFRRGRWKVEHFREAVRRAVAWTIDNRAVFDFLGHPSCLYVTDPRMQTIEMICDLVNRNKDRAAVVDLATIARLRGRHA